MLRISKRATDAERPSGCEVQSFKHKLLIAQTGEDQGLVESIDSGSRGRKFLRIFAPADTA